MKRRMPTSDGKFICKQALRLVPEDISDREELYLMVANSAPNFTTAIRVLLVRHVF